MVSVTTNDKYKLFAWLSLGRQIQRKTIPNGDWRDLKEIDVISIIFNNSYTNQEFRIAPSYIELNGLTYPRPLTEVDEDTLVYCPSYKGANKSYDVFYFKRELHFDLLNNGFLHADANSATLHSRAIMNKFNQYKEVKGIDWLSKELKKCKGASEPDNTYQYYIYFCFHNQEIRFKDIKNRNLKTSKALPVFNKLYEAIDAVNSIGFTTVRDILLANQTL